MTLNGVGGAAAAAAADQTVDGEALASAARTATTSSADITNHNGRGILVFWNISAYAGATSLQLKLQVKDPSSGLYVDMVVPTARTSTGISAYLIGAGSSAGGSLSSSVSAGLPRTFRIQVTHSDATSQTYSVGYSIF